MNRYKLNENIVNIKKEYFIAKIERILVLLEKRNEVYFFENQNIFRHPCIFEKIQRVPSALKLLNNKEKEWLKKNKDGSIKTENIYIYIADTLCALYNNFPTNKDIKRSISLTLEILAIKVMLNPIYKDKQKEDLEELLKELRSKDFSSVDEIYSLLNFEKKLNPELNKFVKNWTRSITFDLKVKVTTLFMDIKKKLKKEKETRIDKITKENNILLTREEMFEKLAERLFEYSLNNFWVEEFKFLSARLIYKHSISYSKVVLKKRSFSNKDEIEEFKDRILYLFDSENTYLSTEYLKYQMLFPKGIKYGVNKLMQQRGVDYHTSRIIIDLYLIASLRGYGDDKAYENFKVIDEEIDPSIILYGFKPYDFLKFKLEGMKIYTKKEEQLILGNETLKDYIKGSFKSHFNVKKERQFNKIIEEMNQIDFEDYLNIFEEYIYNNPKVKVEIVKMFTMIFAEFKKEFSTTKKKPFIEVEQQEKVLKILLKFIEKIK